MGVRRVGLFRHNPPNLDIISPVTPVLVDAWHNEEETRALGSSAAEPDKVCLRLLLLKKFQKSKIIWKCS